ncbi:type II secretion system F family protein [Ferrimonas balearica]|uniref:type II secretion system F family protein n=1 Tax=Ferrimonas balearica TaxID=44012 RepID=UPI001C595C2A|nr:type II secretion system F family protein [Ferrimonas balearica]MBW3165834.1 type II secretion system F family protein [Ferrimonas balearica]MBY6019129.1 type II secretion system F family protein [Halomonas denitrificans]MBY6095733.1 type II secretion system F family protein [Ferrimonas balearica]
MAHYRYRGRDETGALVNGVLEAANESAAADQLMRRAIIPLSLEGVKPQSDFDWRGLFQRPVPLAELLMFTRQMLSLTRSGIPLLQALAGLVESQRHPLMAAALKDIVEQLTAGRPLSAALNQHPRVFNALYVAMVHVGENTGRLDQAFERLSDHLEQEQDTRRRIQSAMRYPLLVLGFIAIAVAVLNILVIPKFAQMFAKFGAELPLPTRILIATSDFFVTWWPAILLGLLGSVIGLRVWLSTDAGRLRWDSWKLRLPIVGSIVSRASLGRFARSLSMMLRGGVPVNQSLSLVADAVDNRFMHDRIIGMRRGIEAGDTISRTAVGAELFTPLVLQMMAVGEETGRIDELLDDVAAFYEREVDYELKGLTAKIEPVLLVLVAGMVLVLALGVYLPMWDMFNAVQGR